MNLITPDAGLLFWMVVIFGIVFFLLAKFGFPIITGSVEKRNRRIGDSIRDAREVEQKMAAMEVTHREMLDQARKEQAAIIGEASDTGKKIVSDAREKARSEAERILTDARSQIASEKEYALRDIRKEVGLLSVDIAEQILRRKLEKDGAQEALLDALVEEAVRNQQSAS